MNSPAPTRIRSVAKAARILLWLGSQPHGATARDTASALGLPLGTAYHLLDTLVDEGLLHKDGARVYGLGPKVGVLAEAFQRELSPPPYLVDALRRLSASTGETTYLSAPRDGDVVVLACVEGSHAVRVRGLHVGFRGWLHARASGKLLLAYGGDDLWRRQLAGELASRTRNTIVDGEALRAEAAAIRARGHAFDEEEFAEGVTGVAAPVLSDGVVLAAFALSAPTERFRANRRELVAATVGAASSVTGA